MKRNVVRLVNRIPRFGRALLVLAAVAGLFAAVWTGPAAARQGGYMVSLMAGQYLDGPPTPAWVKICDVSPPPVRGGCVEWTTVESYRYVDVAPGALWNGKIAICLVYPMKTAVAEVDLSSVGDGDDRVWFDGDWVRIDLRAMPDQEAPSVACL